MFSIESEAENEGVSLRPVTTRNSEKIEIEKFENIFTYEDRNELKSVATCK